MREFNKWDEEGLWTTDHNSIETLALRFAELVEAALIENPVQPLVEGMRRHRQLRHQPLVLVHASQQDRSFSLT